MDVPTAIGTAVPYLDAETWPRNLGNLALSGRALCSPGIRRAIECLEIDFANDLFIDEVADEANEPQPFRPDLSVHIEQRSQRLQKPPFSL